MSDLVITPEEERRGILHAMSAYTLWGVMPLYWSLLDQVPPIELVAHRVLWCALAVGAITLWRGRLPAMAAIFGAPRVFWALVLSSLLISTNWGVFIYAVQVHRVIEGSFGYFVTPLISMAMGMTLFGERVSRVRLAAMVLTFLAMGLQAVAAGAFPLDCAHSGGQLRVIWLYPQKDAGRCAGWPDDGNTCSASCDIGLCAVSRAERNRRVRK